jgi:hypothetical protein
LRVPTLEERALLANVVNEVYELCDETIRSAWLPRDMIQQYDEALLRVNVAMQDGLEILLSDDPEVSERLDRAGLGGAELDLKVTGWRRWLRRFRERRTTGLLRRAFKWGNVILGSLSSVVVAFEPLREIKESIEAGLEEPPEADASEAQF